MSENQGNPTPIVNETIKYKGEERPKRSIDISQLAAALAKAQGEIINAEKDGAGNYGAYSTLAATWVSIRKPLSNNGIAIYQRPLKIDGKPAMCTMLMHSSGQFIDDSELEMIYDSGGRMNAMQAMGSAVTYSRRYTLQAATGVAPQDDDDGAGSGDPKPQGQKSQSNQKKQSGESKQRDEKPKDPLAPKDVVYPFESSIKGKKIGDVETLTLEKAKGWLKEQMALSPKPKNISQIAFIYSQVKAVLIDRNPPTPPGDSAPMPDDIPENVNPKTGEVADPFPPDDVQMSPEEGSQERQTKKNQPVPEDYVIPKVKSLEDLSDLEGKALRQISEKELREAVKIIDRVMKVVPPPSNLGEIFGVRTSITAFFGNMGMKL